MKLVALAVRTTRWIALGFAAGVACSACERKATVVRPDRVADASVGDTRSDIIIRELASGTFVQTAHSEGVIFKSTEGKKPTAGEVVAFELGLAAAVAASDAPTDPRDVLSRLPRLKRQYFVSSRDDLSATMFCVAEGEDWKQAPVGWADGGTCNVRAWWSRADHAFYLKPAGGPVTRLAE